MSGQQKATRGWESEDRQTAGGSWIAVQKGTTGPIAPPAKPWQAPKRWS